MPIILLILSAVGGAIWWWVRSNPRDALGMAVDTATTLKNAPRRLAFRRQTNLHPVEAIDDPHVAIGAMAMSFVGLDALPTQEQYDRLHVQLRSHLRCSEDDAQELKAYGRWIIQQCGGEMDAFDRVARRLKKINGVQSLELLQDVLADVAPDGLADRQQEAVTDLSRIFR